jgi:hypothetical protein
MWLGGIVKALKTPEARGRLAHFTWFERMGVSTHTPPKACGWRAAERRDAYKLSGGGRKLLHELDGCRDEGRWGKVSAGNAVRRQTGGVRWSNCRSLHTPREAAGLLRRHGGCEDAGLVWQLYAPPATR